MLLEKRNEEWGWGERSEAEAIIGLHLANDTWFAKDAPSSYISVKQMNLDLLSAISKYVCLSWPGQIHIHITTCCVYLNNNVPPSLNFSNLCRGLLLIGKPYSCRNRNEVKDSRCAKLRFFGINKQKLFFNLILEFTCDISALKQH
jgi:hypothetical protein